MRYSDPAMFVVIDSERLNAKGSMAKASGQPPPSSKPREISTLLSDHHFLYFILTRTNLAKPNP